MKKLFLLALLIIAYQFLYAQSPNTISWQGIVTDNDGNALDGTYDLTVKLYDGATEGTALWTETHTAMEITDGIVNLILGSVESLDLDFSEKYWLEITVDEGEPLSRLELTSVPYAMYAKNAPTTLEGTPLILKDSLGNVRMKFDPDAGRFEMLDNDTVWYSVVVNSPPRVKNVIDEDNYSITEGNKTEYYSNRNAGFGPNLTQFLKHKEVIVETEGDKTTTTEKSYQYNNTGTSSRSFDKKTEVENNKDENGNVYAVTTTKEESRVDENGSVTHGSKTVETKSDNWSTHTRYDNDGTSKEILKEFDKDYEKYITKHYDADGNCYEENSGLQDNQGNDKINKFSSKEYNEDGSVKTFYEETKIHNWVEKKHIESEKRMQEDGVVVENKETETFNPTGKQLNKTIHNETIIDGVKTKERIVSDTREYKDYVHETSDATVGNITEIDREFYSDGTIKSERNEVRRWEAKDEWGKYPRVEEITEKEWDSDGNQVKEVKIVKRDNKEVSREEKLFDEEGNQERSNKTETLTYKSNNNNKKSTTTYTYKYLDGVLESENKKYESVYTPDGSKVIQEQQVERVDWNEIAERSRTVSIPADGSPVTEDVSETLYGENRVVQVRTNTKKENGEVVEKSVSKNKPGSSYATQREKTTYSRDENDNMTEKNEMYDENGQFILRVSDKVDKSQQQIIREFYGSDGKSSEVIQNAEGIKTNGLFITIAFKLFRIDHPTDDTKYLQHASIESNEVLNQYSGNVTTDDDGMATVSLPDYFDDINTDFRYVLTVIGTTFARAIVYSEITDNEFEIKTDEPNIKVSWQVTAKRNDEYMQNNPFEDEIDK